MSTNNAHDAFSTPFLRDRVVRSLGPLVPKSKTRAVVVNTVLGVFAALIMLFAFVWQSEMGESGANTTVALTAMLAVALPMLAYVATLHTLMRSSQDDWVESHHTRHLKAREYLRELGMEGAFEIKTNEVGARLAPEEVERLAAYTSQSKDDAISQIVQACFAYVWVRPDRIILRDVAYGVGPSELCISVLRLVARGESDEVVTSVIVRALASSNEVNVAWALTWIDFPVTAFGAHHAAIRDALLSILASQAMGTDLWLRAFRAANRWVDAPSFNQALLQSAERYDSVLDPEGSILDELLYISEMIDDTSVRTRVRVLLFQHLGFNRMPAVGSELLRDDAGRQGLYETLGATGTEESIRFFAKEVAKIDPRGGAVAMATWVDVLLERSDRHARNALDALIDALSEGGTLDAVAPLLRVASDGPRGLRDKAKSAVRQIQAREVGHDSHGGMAIAAEVSGGGLAVAHHVGGALSQVQAEPVRDDSASDETLHDHEVAEVAEVRVARSRR